MRWKPARERFLSRVKNNGACWEWQGALSGGTGYGCFYDGKPYSAHRYSWLLHFGDIPSGLCVLHKCDNRKCVNPDHLWIGTKKANSMDMARKGRHLGPGLKGQDHGEAKLIDDDVREIRRSTLPGILLAQDFGVSPSLISLIRLRKAWKHIE